MNNQLTDHQAPVTDEELDQMIWKLERDGMTPKLLSLMRELREVRRAAGAAQKCRSNEKVQVLPGNSPVTPDGWREEAEKLAEAYGAAFVIFRHGEEPVCADPTKFWFGFDPAAPKEAE